MLSLPKITQDAYQEVNDIFLMQPFYLYLIKDHVQDKNKELLYYVENNASLSKYPRESELLPLLVLDMLYRSGDVPTVTEQVHHHTLIESYADSYWSKSIVKKIDSDKYLKMTIDNFKAEHKDSHDPIAATYITYNMLDRQLKEDNNIYTPLIDSMINNLTL